MTTSTMPQGVEQTATAQRAEISPLDLSRIAQDLQIRKVQVEAVVHLLDEGNTIPFITRYRKERTGGLDEEVLRIIQERVGQARALAERVVSILKLDRDPDFNPFLRKPSPRGAVIGGVKTMFGAHPAALTKPALPEAKGPPPANAASIAPANAAAGPPEGAAAALYAKAQQLRDSGHIEESIVACCDPTCDAADN